MAIVTTEQARLYLQISHSVEDSLIPLMIDGAQEFVAATTGLYFHDGDGSVTEHLDGGNESLWPSRLPIQSVTSVTDRESGEAYEYKATDSRILRKTANLVWPGGNAAAQRWAVVYSAGYDIDSAPVGLRLAVLDLVYRAYNNRGGQSSSSGAGHSMNWASIANSDIMDILDRHSIRRLAG